MSDQTKLPPIVRQLDPSPEQLPAILARDCDIAVTAGAGTGKTRTLVARYLSLLADGLPLRSVVAITFTKKAAREMRNRVREVIRSFLDQIGPADPESGFWLDVYQGLDAARISTIHSLAGEIIRQHPAELGIDPDFALLDESQTARIKVQAVESALADAARDPRLAHLFVSLGDWNLRKVIRELLDRRLDVQQVIDQGLTDPWLTWEPLLVDPIRQLLADQQVISGLDQLAGLEDEGILTRAEEAGDLLAEDLRIVIKNWREIRLAWDQEDWFRISSFLGPLREHLKQKGRQENWAPFNPRQIIRGLQSRFADLLPSGDLDLEPDRNLAQRIVPALIEIFSTARDRYQAEKTAVQGLDFDDLEQKALDLLLGHPLAAAYWQGQVQALLVDEYQDTNHRQRQLVNLLNGEGGKLFIVGDGKQSIYRFRGADVAVFRQEQGRIAGDGATFQLRTSYRAHRALVEDLNTALEPVLGHDDTIPYLEPFQPLVHYREEPAWQLEQPYLELHLGAGTKAEGALQVAARAAAARIAQLADPGGKIAFSDIAILCRAASSFPAYESALEELGIPYLTIAGGGFYDRPEVRDLLNALQAFAEPDDDLAFAGYLRSPAGGLTDAEILEIRDYQVLQRLPGLLGAARQYVGQLPPDRSQVLAGLLETRDEMTLLVDRVLPADLLVEFLNRTGILAAYSSLGLTRSVQNIKKLVSDAQSSGLVNIAGFLELITELRGVAVREGEAQAIAEGAVQIMTVHQAKGLEFPIVVLGDAGKKEPSGRGVILDERFGLVLPHKEQRIMAAEDGTLEVQDLNSQAYQLAAQQERLQEDAESDRLLYVAATRTRDLLLISGVSGNPTKEGSMRSLEGWLGKLAEGLGLNDLELSFQAEGDQLHQASLSKGGLRASLALYEAAYPGLPAAPVQLPQGAAAVVGDQAPGFQEDGFPARAGWSPERLDRKLRRAAAPSLQKEAPAWMVGQVVHRALELWKFPAEAEIEFQDWARAEFRDLGLAEDKALQDGCRKARRILERFQDSDLFQRMSASPQLRHEVPFSFRTGQGTLDTGVIDALFREGEKWILVEFKTDQIRDQAWYDRLWQKEDYQQQVARYLDVAQAILGVRPDPILCFLNYQDRVHLVSDRW